MSFVYEETEKSVKHNEPVFDLPVLGKLTWKELQELTEQADKGWPEAQEKITKFVNAVRYGAADEAAA